MKHARSGYKAILLSLGVLFAGADMARAQSRECDNLYYARNDFYDQKGLCFTRPGALRRYPNNPRTCVYDSLDELPMSERDHKTMALLRAREIELGCRRK
jgi:hypothetical protein